MSYRGPCLAALIFACVLPGRVAWAQQVPSSPLDTIRTGVPSDLDNRIFDQWFNEQLGQLKANPTPEGVQRFVQAFSTQYQNPDNSEAFKTRFAERASALFLTEFQRGRELDNEVARAIAQVLLDMKSIRGLDALLAGLSFPDQVTRYKCAMGMAAIRDAIEADARVAAATLQTLSGIGADEDNGVVAGAIYRAMDYRDHVNEAVAAIVQMIAGRARLLDRGQADFGRGELAALAIIDSQPMESGLQADRVAAVQALATLLRVEVERYADGKMDAYTEAAVAETIDKTESTIKKLVGNQAGQLPSVSDQMQKGGPAAPTQMQLELLEWIGSKDKQGILNQAPWNVPAGAPS